MSDASAMWTAIVDNDYNPVDWLPVFRNDTTPIEVLREKFPMTYKEGNVYYTYTFQDIVEKLPIYIEYKHVRYYLDISRGAKNVSYYAWVNDDSVDDDYLEVFNYDNLIDGVFELLKWCIENKYINKE